MLLTGDCGCIQAAVAVLAASITTFTSPLPCTAPAPTAVWLVQPAVLATNVAVTAVAADITTVQVVAVPEHPPDQPLKRQPLAAAAVSVTEVPAGKVDEQEAAQLTPVGVEVTVPLPEIVSPNVCVVGAATKAAVTDCAADMLTVQVSVVPLQAPDHPLKF
jgi:hypothetical protein